ncbi:hypothetical protein [Streptomyces termitum]|uniref:hypothetical protein n=1 Tax=Streptomyces termitum TaxID=67368 RepID=UPI0033B9E9E9
MVDNVTHRIMTAMRGGDILAQEAPEIQEPKVDAGTRRVIQEAGYQTNADRFHEAQFQERQRREKAAAEAAFERRVSDTAQGEQISREAARAKITRLDAEAAQADTHRRANEAMAAQTRAAREQRLRNLTAPVRVQYQANGDPAPGTTVNDLIAEAARGDSMVRKTRLALAVPTYDELAALGFFPADDSDETA